MLDLIREKAISSEQLQAVIDSGLLADLFDADISKVTREDFRRFLGLTLQPTFVGEINYADSWEKRLEETGMSPKSITSCFTSEQFPIKGSGVKKVRYELVTMGRRATSGEVLVAFTKRGLKRPGPEHGLDFARRYPDEQRKAPVVILCSPGVDGRGRRVVPVLRVGDFGRWLGSDDYGLEWNVRYVFLGVRKD